MLKMVLLHQDYKNDTCVLFFKVNESSYCIEWPYKSSHRKKFFHHESATTKLSYWYFSVIIFLLLKKSVNKKPLKYDLSSVYVNSIQFCYNLGDFLICLSWTSTWWESKIVHIPKTTTVLKSALNRHFLTFLAFFFKNSNLPAN